MMSLRERDKVGRDEGIHIFFSTRLCHMMSLRERDKVGRDEGIHMSTQGQEWSRQRQ